jgi:uncharacterized membrane protein YczE
VALGGTVGAGTLVFALTIGPLMQAGLRLCDRSSARTLGCSTAQPAPRRG